MTPQHHILGHTKHRRLNHDGLPVVRWCTPQGERVE
jgi:hypothetical protein